MYVLSGSCMNCRHTACLASGNDVVVCLRVHQSISRQKNSDDVIDSEKKMVLHVEGLRCPPRCLNSIEQQRGQKRRAWRRRSQRDTRESSLVDGGASDDHSSDGRLAPGQDPNEAARRWKKNKRSGKVLLVAEERPAWCIGEINLAMATAAAANSGSSIGFVQIDF
jgi:hypothetical protein